MGRSIEKLRKKMRKTFGTVLLAVLYVASVGTAHASAGFNGHSLQTICVSKNPADQTVCQLYIRGVVETWRMALAASKSPVLNLFCMPNNYGPPQIAPVVRKYLSRYPNKLGEGAHVLTIAALADAFPCR